MIPLPPVEVGIAHGSPEFGSVTSQMKVLDQRPGARSLSLRLSAPAHSTQQLFVRINDANVHLRVDGAEMPDSHSEMLVRFPSGNGYVEKEVRLSW